MGHRRTAFPCESGHRGGKAEFSSIIGLSIDTWGVDYVLLRGEVHVLPVYAYRDSRTEAVIPQVYSILPFSGAVPQNRDFNFSLSTPSISFTPTSWPGGWRA